MARYQAVVNKEMSEEDRFFFIVQCGLGKDKCVDSQKLIFEASPEEVEKLHEQMTGKRILNPQTKKFISWYLTPC